MHKREIFLIFAADLKHKKMGIYKYQAEIDALIQQGLKMPKVVKPNDLKGFRFVFSTDMSKSYLPNYIMKPQRAIMNGQRKVDVGGYALSCFTEKDKAIKFYHLLAKNMRNIYKAIGDRISSGIVTNKDGNITTPASNGHYNLFEFPSCDLSKTFKLEEGNYENNKRYLHQEAQLRQIQESGRSYIFRWTIVVTLRYQQG